MPTVGTEFLRFRRLQKEWCLRSESNQRHADFQSAALPTELQRHLAQEAQTRGMIKMATRNGLEPSTSSVTGWRANRLHHRARYNGGNNRARTYDLLLVRQMLSQLSYAPNASRFRSAHQRHDTLYTGTAYLSSIIFTFFPPFFIRYFAAKAEHPQG